MTDKNHFMVRAPDEIIRRSEQAPLLLIAQADGYKQMLLYTMEKLTECLAECQTALEIMEGK